MAVCLAKPAGALIGCASCSRLLAALLVGLALGSACAHAGTQPAAMPPAALDEYLLPEEREVADLINEYRARKGFPALSIDPTLSRVAREHSANMARTSRLAHVLDGRGPGDRAAAAGFQGRVGENCATGSGTSPRGFLDLWLGSAAHRANLLVFREGALGVGFATTPDGNEQYLTAMFGGFR